MKGVVFQLLSQVVTEARGEETWESLLDRTGLDGAYTSLGSYPDGDLARLVEAASAALGESPEAALRWFGRQALPLLAAKDPRFLGGHRSTIPFLLTHNEVIHPEVRKIYPGADVPVFEFVRPDEKTLLVRYNSPRRLCALAEGLIEGAAARLGETVAMNQSKCMHRGDTHCEIRCEFERRGA